MILAMQSNHAPTPSWEIPIVDSGGRIVGWTVQAPQFLGAVMHHEEAELLIGERIAAAYVQVNNPVDAARAATPPGWQGPWRCLGLCSRSLLKSDGALSDTPIVASSRRAQSEPTQSADG